MNLYYHLKTRFLALSCSYISQVYYYAIIHKSWKLDTCHPNNTGEFNLLHSNRGRSLAQSTRFSDGVFVCCQRKQVCLGWV